jgi:amino acid transporter
LVIYLATAILCAAALPRSTLASDYGAMKSIAAAAPLIDAGIISATLSSALASLLGAPRILQSLAKDRIFPFLLPFAEGSGPTNNPRRGVFLTGAIALAVVAIGNLNLIAAIVSMFFVITYGLLNYATYFEARGRSPSFRPSLRWYRPRISLLGSLASLAVMLAIDLAAGLAALAIVFGVYQYLKRSAIPARWADGQRSYHLQIVREHLLAASSRAEHPRDWRPQIVAFSDSGSRRKRLLTFAGWIEGHSGLTTVVRVLEDGVKQVLSAREKAEEELAQDLSVNRH